MKRFDTDQPGYGMSRLATASGDVLSHIALVQSASSLFEPGMEAPVQQSVYRAGGKRLFETLLILLSLPFFVPIVALCVVALWIEGGNPFYRQTRLGQNGKRFFILKLRTMVRDADTVLEDYLASDPEMRREWDERPSGHRFNL